MLFRFILILLCAAYITSCSHREQNKSYMNGDKGSKTLFDLEKLKKNMQESEGGSKSYKTVSPTVYIYKTKKNYSHLVPIIMDANRTRIVSYPAPSDLIRNGQLTLPTALNGGYWLDNRGITPNVVFLTYTYEEYAKMPTAPSKEEMLKHIADMYPLINIVNCGKRVDYKDIVTELNQYIQENGLR